MISISVVSAHTFERHHITIYFLILLYLFLILIFFLSCFYNSFDHFGFPGDVYFLSFPAGLFILSYKAFNQCFPHDIYFAFLCGAHRGKHVRRFYWWNLRTWGKKAPLRDCDRARCAEGRKLPCEALSFVNSWTWCISSSLILGGDLLCHWLSGTETTAFTVS